MFDNYQEFISEVLDGVRGLGIDISGLEMDHIAKTTATKAEYNELRPQLLLLGEMVAEDLVGGRRVGIVRLKEPLEHENLRIPGVELIEPVNDGDTESDFHHAEFVIPEGFEAMMAKYPDVKWEKSTMNRPEYPHLCVKGFPKVKFHEVNIFDTVERQKSKNKET